MSDRRFLIVLVALLGALIAALVGLVALLELRDPVSATGETGVLTDLTPELVLLASLSGATVVGGLAVAGVLVRRQLRGFSVASRPPPGRDEPG